jgi:predicted MFS family arabinose efflux permease
LALGALASFSIGRAVDRGYGKLVMTGGSIAAGALLLTFACVSNIVALYAVVGMLGAVQTATLYEAVFAVIARRVGAANSRSAITTVTLWGGFSSTVFIPLIQWMIDHWGWRGALEGLGAINLLITASLHAAVISAKHDHASTGHPGSETGHGHVARILRRPIFWLLTIAFTAHTLAFTTFTFHLYPLLLERGFSTQDVVLAMALIGPAQVAGRLAITTLGRRASVRKIGMTAVTIYPFAFIGLLTLPPNLPLVIGATVLFGASNGILTIVRGAAVPEMLTPQGYGAVMGVMNTPGTIARAAAHVASAILWQAAHSYEPVLVAVTIAALILATSFWSAGLFSSRAGSHRLSGVEGRQ